MSGSAYHGCVQRTFEQALLHMLAQDYGLLGSQRILELLAEDIQTLVEQFYPAPEHISNGWLVWTGTLASDTKVRPGFRAGEHELVTLAWPVILPEDLESVGNLPSSETSRQALKEWFKRRLQRIVEYGLDHPRGPVLLTLADLSAMTGLATVQVSQYLAELRQETGLALGTKGYHFDQGMRPTHKREVIALYEAGVDEADIARRTGHSPASVGHYIRDYESVKLLLPQGVTPATIARLTGLQPNVVHDYIELAQQYHPELAHQAASETQPG